MDPDGRYEDLMMDGYHMISWYEIVSSCFFKIFRMFLEWRISDNFTNGYDGGYEEHFYKAGCSWI